MPASTPKKSTAATVFVRFIPSSSDIRRHHLEDAFSHIGPIKKSAVIHSKDDNSSSYAFVKYTKQEDADEAAKKLHNQKISVGDTRVELRVQLASADPYQRDRKRKLPDTTTTTTTTTARKETEGAADNEDDFKKKNCRVIVRNLSFYAKASQVQKALEKFGSVHDVHLPMVQKQHRGFCFVTFDSKAAAASCVAAQSVEIAKRQSQLAWSLSKQAYESNKVVKKNIEAETKVRTSRQTKGNEVKEEDADNNDNDQNDAEDDSDDGGSSDSDQDSDDDSDSEEEKVERGVEVKQNRSLFVRNLPFDATRHDLFELFRKFGRIDSIYLVKSQGVFKGSAFVAFEKPAAAQRALNQAGSGDSAFVPLKNANSDGGDALALKGRPLRVNLAVDKGTASTFEDQQMLKADRRHLYLQTEGRVEDDWDYLPDVDRQKRQAAWAEKQKKLRSPLFFINPTRLSIRNLAKHVDEAALKELVARATEKGTAKADISDGIAHVKALGNMTSRDLVSAVKQSKETVMPTFDPKNIKKFIPSVYINRDFVGKASTSQVKAPSRGFGFVEFTHHTHALACLRELNNNRAYAIDYVAGGKTASMIRKPKRKMDDTGPPKIPRLIVEFTVENTVKAKQQSEHRSAQQANKIKQKQESREARDDKKEKKKSRGARQREKKRLKKEGLLPESSSDNDENEPAKEIMTPDMEKPPTKKAKLMKPPKRRKVDMEEEKLNAIVKKYTKTDAKSEATESESSVPQRSKRRWFE